MRIITISRQFGSGGRELGKRLADRLGWDYYDKEIIVTLAAEYGLNPDSVQQALIDHGWHKIHLSYRNSFSKLLHHPGMNPDLLDRERTVLRCIAALGNDCIIVGRDADVLLKSFHPFRVFVCADTQARLARCMLHESKHPIQDRLSEKQILRNIRRIDRSRANTRELLSGKPRDDRSAFELTVNTTGWEIKPLTAALGDFALLWFASQRSGSAQENDAQTRP